MTTVDVVFRYGVPPTEAAALAIARMREVYGIRRVQFSEAEKTVRVEYDSTRLTESVVHQLLRRGGLDVIEKMVLYTVPPPPEPVAATEIKP
jgi:copper chaperone CopZ